MKYLACLLALPLAGQLQQLCTCEGVTNVLQPPPGGDCTLVTATSIFYSRGKCRYSQGVCGMPIRSCRYEVIFEETGDGDCGDTCTAFSAASCDNYDIDPCFLQYSGLASASVFCQDCTPP
jgi:hypothetical protein